MTACNMPKTIYTNDIIQINGQRKSINIYMSSIYTYEKLLLGVHGPYIHIYNDLEACVQNAANIYIYIYTHLNLGAQG